jgi:signal transduction histidine kinase
MLRSLERDVHTHAWDYLVGSAMVALAIVALVTRIDVQSADEFRFHADTWWSWVATIAVCGSLIGRRRWPLRSFAIGLAFVVPLELGHHRDSIAFFAIVIAFCSVAAYSPPRLAWRAVAMTAGLYVLLLATGTMIVTTAPLVGLLFLSTAFAFGVLLRHGRTRQDHDVEAATARGIAEIETAELQAADERLRMAQELHDVVAHSLSVIAVQAGIGVHLIDRQPAEAGRALDAIRTVSHTTAKELSRLLDVLRDGGVRDDALATQTIGDIEKLIEQTRTTGLPITYNVNGSVSAVPAGVSLAAYRIIQEALTNVVRHAGHADVTVTIQLTGEGLTLCVDDNGHGTPVVTESGGHGLIGMVERAQLYGGNVRTGPRPGGGFRVQATIPYLAPSVIARNGPKAADIATLNTPTKFTRVPAWSGDVLIAAVFAGLTTVQILLANPGNGPRFTPTDPWAWSLKLACCMILILRRRYPTTTYTCIWAFGLALAIGDYQVGVITFVLLIGVYSVASYATKCKTGGALVGTYIGMAFIAWSKPPDLTTSGAVWICFLFTAIATAGYAVRRDRDLRMTALNERENVTDAQTRRARLIVTTERLRIADELNTVITQSIQAITNRAGTGSEMIETDPAAARQALEVISAISREALNDLRRLLKRIRAEHEPAVYVPIAPTLLTTSSGATL